jgi:predicted transcriptional regulator
MSLPTLQQKIAEQFLAKFAQTKDADATKIDQLRKLLAEKKKPTGEDFVRIFTLPAGGELK